MAFARKRNKDSATPEVVEDDVPSREHALATGSTSSSGGSPASPTTTPSVPRPPVPAATNKRLGEQLIGSRLITPEQLEAALAA